MLIAVTVAAVSATIALAKSNGQDRDSSAAAPSCQKNLLVNFEIDRDGQPVREVPIWQTSDGSAFFFVSGMTVDADGAPNAYNADNTGLDDLSNAGEPGHWQGIVQDETGIPYVQGPDDPFPGFYVSCTSLVDRTKSISDPHRYVDASKIPYVVLPGGLARDGGAGVGDFAFVANLRNGTSTYAIFADVGTLGEGSIALADRLGIHSDARIGGTRGGILYVIFPGSGDHTPHTVDEINDQAGKQVALWSGVEKLNACAADSAPTAPGVQPVSAPQPAQ
jgi:Fungal chitosanase of glycosyl hydrolase group 75